MSQRTGAPERRLRDHSPQIEAVRREIEARCGDRNVEAVRDFASIFLRRAPDAFLRSRGISDLTSLALAVYDFVARSRPDRVDVEVVNPTMESEGWEAPVTVVRAIVGERPFVVDTVRELLHAEGLAIEHMVYPMLDVERDAEGKVERVRAPGDGGAKEALVHCEIEQVGDPGVLEHIRSEITRCLEDVVLATDDFVPMLGAVAAVVQELSEHRRGGAKGGELDEIQAFLEWLSDGGFVFLGYRAYDIGKAKGRKSITVREGTGLGLLRDESGSGFAEPVPLEELSAAQRDLVEDGPVLIISKTNAESTVHRRTRMDYVGVRRTDDEGNTIGEHRFIGLFTSKAYADAAESIPILRRKLRAVLDDAAVRKGTHDYKAIITIFNSLPRAELFVSSADEIAEDIRTVLTSYSTDDVKVSLREDPLHRGISAMVIVPKDRFSGDVRKEIEIALVEALEGDVLNYHLALGEGDQARLHFYMAASEESLQRVDPSALEMTVAHIIRTWSDLVEEQLEKLRPPEEAHRLVRAYGKRFSLEYQAATEAETAAADILQLEAMATDGRTVSVVLANNAGRDQVAGVEGATQLKLFLRGERLVLSDFMPILDHLGLRVIAMQPFDVRRNGEPDATIYVFAVLDRESRPLDVFGRGELLSETLLAARAGDVVSDALNALVVSAGLHWREIDVLRGLVAYAFQVGAVPSRSALPTALTRYPGIARELFDLFQTRFDPGAWESVEQRLEALKDVRTAFQASLRGVELLADDRALRTLESLICSTLRTNYYKGGGRAAGLRSGGVPYVSYKLLVGKDIEHSRPTELLFEVWVHSSRMEGIHLRGSTVARGGIRWSDRPDDFRTEVLGLVKTQMIKNAVIVPGGSKGGFILRRVPSDTEARFAEGKAQYQTLMRGLLDLTDNLEGGQPVRAPGVVAYDPVDPYLVVAADKGTATFSDLANSVAAEYGFWLGDAFASGGSNGYDHKAVGITARGGWECVKRHFREKGKDIQTEPFTVVGIGDMSGDVFGNGMLLSEQIRLIAAFDHRHIFIDPDPDPVTSFAERRRIFGLGRSSWNDYDRKALSEGGMIVPRGAKEVELTAQAKRALALTDEEARGLSGESLIRCVMRAPAELLWNGGIGTYVKASTQTHHDAGDPTNDAVRVDATELRCEVVGEGGNLGFTQRARVEYALGGGRINTDALDNSAGVDLSDHEVNLKILMASAVASGAMTVERRNEVLEELTESVAELVLHDNRSQSLAVSLDERRARESTDDFRDLMFDMEKAGDLDRVAEGLPSRDVLAERREVGRAMARPELCVLLAYAKLGLKDELLKGRLPDDPVTESYLVGYYPPAAIVAAGQLSLSEHPLRREIVTCQLTNDLVDLMGATFVYRVRRDTGASAEQVVRAWLVASRLADHRVLLRQMGEQRALNSRVVTRWLLGLARVLERATRWVLQNSDADVSPAVIVEANLEGLATLRGAFASVVVGEEKELFEARVREIRDVGADDTFSTRLITLRFLDQLLEILEIARETGAAPLATARAYYQASGLFDIPWLRRKTFAAAGAGQWEHRASQALSEDLSRAHRKLVVAAVYDGGGGRDDYMACVRDRDVERFRGILAELKEEDTVGLAAVSVATRELASVADRTARGTAGERRR